MAVGNVGEKLAPYVESDTFLSRDAGFTWEEVHKDAHLWEFGDSGSILVMINDEEPTDHVLFTTDEGINWREYKFTNEKIRVRSIVTVPSDTSRRFVLFGGYARSPGSVAVHLDFTALTSLHCACLASSHGGGCIDRFMSGKLDIEDPGHDDFELWSPSEERAERCLFGRQVNQPHVFPHPPTLVIHIFFADFVPSSKARSQLCRRRPTKSKGNYCQALRLHTV